MESINQDLQASYNVIKLLEGSNINSERLFQSLPGIFAIINENDEILRGNKTLTTHLGVDTDDVLRLPFDNLFSKESWNVFANHLKQLRDSLSDHERVEFELGIEDPDMVTGEKTHFWHLRKMDVVSQTEGSLIIIIGEDISKLRESERQLNEIFASIPLGIFTVNSQGNIETFHSSYLKHLLDETEFAGKSVKEVLFEPAMKTMTDEEKEGVVSLDFVMGQGATTYEMLSAFFPKQIYYPIKELKSGGRWLKVIYQPVIYDDTVKRLLIILEDRTEYVKTQEMKKRAKYLEDQSVQRVFQLKQVDKKGLHLYIKELNILVKRLQDEMQAKADNKQKFATAHGIKGIARVAGFTFLKNAAKDLESEFQDDSTEEADIIEAKCEVLYNEFFDLLALYNAIYPKKALSESRKDKTLSLDSKDDQLSKLFSQYNALLNVPNSLNKTLQIDQLFWGLLSYHYDYASDLEEGILTQANSTAAALGKKVNIQFDWGNVLIKKTVVSALNECLVHLINNAIDHGIEAPAVRDELGKERTGIISIVVSEKNSILTCDVSDDGAGIDYNVIREAAAKKNLKTTIELAEMSDEEVLQLIFHPGFSTSNQVSDTSGRGIGMEAVMGNLEKFRGAIHIDSKKGHGTTFQLSFKLIGRDDLQFVKQCYPLPYFKKVMTDYVKTFAEENRFDIEMNFGAGFEKGIFYGDLIKTVVCLSSYVGHFAFKGKMLIDFKLSKEYYIKCSGKVIESENPKSPTIQFIAPMQLCRYFIHKDNGKLVEDDNIFTIHMPCYFHANGAPNLYVGYTQKVDQNLAKGTFKTIKQVAGELDVNVSFSGDKEKVNMLIYPTLMKYRNSMLLPYPGFTVSSSKKMIQQDMLRGIEQLVTLKKQKK